MKWNGGWGWLNTRVGAQSCCGNLHLWRYYSIDWARPQATWCTSEDDPALSGRLDWTTSRGPFHMNYSVILWKAKSRSSSKVSSRSTKGGSLGAVFIRLSTFLCGIWEKDLQKHHEKREAHTEELLLPAGGGKSWLRQPAWSQLRKSFLSCSPNRSKELSM